MVLRFIEAVPQELLHFRYILEVVRHLESLHVYRAKRILARHRQRCDIRPTLHNPSQFLELVEIHQLFPRRGG